MVKKLNDNRVILFLVGQAKNSDYVNELKKQARELKITGQIIFTGHRFDVPLFLDGCEITYLVSQFEGFGNVIVESFLMKTPVIATALNPIREIIDNGVNGYIVPVGDVESLCQKTRQLLSFEELRKKFGAAGREKAEKLFSKDKFIKESITAFHKAFAYNQKNKHNAIS
jgi:glycosyltransferase involved in cell wall biosynthesis